MGNGSYHRRELTSVERVRRINKHATVEKRQSMSCCAKCCTLVVFLSILATAGGITLWQLLPRQISDEVGKIISSGANRPTVASNSEKPLTSMYMFDQCDPSSADCCNGVSTICDMFVDDILFAGVHNAMSTYQDGFRLAPNHNYRFELALQQGYRAFSMDIGMCGSLGLQFIHGKCILGKRDPLVVFENLNKFLDDNPNEVVIFAIQVNNFAGSGPVDLDELYTLMQQVEGFTERFVIHDDPSKHWPTLRELIALDQRILMFQFNSEPCSSSPFGCPAGFYDYFNYVAEAGFMFNSIEDMHNVTAACSVPRGASGRANFYAINLFTEVPYEQDSMITNSKEFIESQMVNCSEFQYGVDVNIAYVDFWEIGDMVEVTQEHNKKLGDEFLSKLNN
jgi:hypothetical protein